MKNVLFAIGGIAAILGAKWALGKKELAENATIDIQKTSFIATPKGLTVKFNAIIGNPTTQSINITNPYARILVGVPQTELARTEIIGNIISITPMDKVSVPIQLNEIPWLTLFKLFSAFNKSYNGTVLSLFFDYETALKPLKMACEYSFNVLKNGISDGILIKSQILIFE